MQPDRSLFFRTMSYLNAEPLSHVQGGGGEEAAQHGDAAHPQGRDHAPQGQDGKQSE